MEMDEGFRNSGEPIEPQAPTPNVKPLEELEHLLSVLKEVERQRPEATAARAWSNGSGPRGAWEGRRRPPLCSRPPP